MERPSLPSLVKLLADNVKAGVLNKFDFTQPYVSIEGPSYNLGDMFEVKVKLESGLFESALYQQIKEKIVKSLEALVEKKDTMINLRQDTYAFDVSVENQPGFNNSKLPIDKWTITFYFKDQVFNLSLIHI